MEFRDKLISSEMRHVTELVNLLSCELVILQDFLVEEFGSRYSKFRKRHALAGAGESHLHASSSSNKAQPAKGSSKGRVGVNERRVSKPSSSRNCDSESVGNVDIADSALADENEEDGEVQFSSDIQDFAVKDVENDHSGDSSESESDYYNTTGDMDWTESGSGSTTNRKHIWEKYDCSKLPNGKKLAKCRKCHQSVSPVPKRLQKHYNQCVLGKCQAETSTPPAAVFSTPGRKPKGSVWLHFDRITTEDGQVIITCNYCTKKVSNHVTRMARHLESCSEFSDASQVQSQKDSSIK